MCDDRTFVCVAGGETATPAMEEVDAETYQHVVALGGFMLQCVKAVKFGFGDTCPEFGAGGLSLVARAARWDLLAAMGQLPEKSVEWLKCLQQLATSAGSCCVLMNDFAMFCDRPLHISISQTGDRAAMVLHSEVGPACEYRDGWKLWFIDGEMVDETVVMHPEMQTSHQLDLEPNPRVRKIRQRRYAEAKRKLQA